MGECPTASQGGSRGSCSVTAYPMGTCKCPPSPSVWVPIHVSMWTWRKYREFGLPVKELHEGWDRGGLRTSSHEG